MYYVKCGPKKSNMGDLIGPYIYEKLQGVPPQQITKNTSQIPNVLLTCGSIIQPQVVLANSTIWGSGIINKNFRLIQKPKDVRAVRGPLSRAALIKNGVNCPAIYGDPGLLLPIFYKPKLLPKKFRVGIIPHYVDYAYFKSIFEKLQLPDVQIIEMDQSVEKVCDEIANCEYTISSSLHGIIVSHAYGIKSAWMTTKNKLWGDNIKYDDYYASIGVSTSVRPIPFSEVTPSKQSTLHSIISACPQVVTMPDLKLLLEVCPFRKT